MKLKSPPILKILMKPNYQYQITEAIITEKNMDAEVEAEKNYLPLSNTSNDKAANDHVREGPEVSFHDHIRPEDLDVIKGFHLGERSSNQTLHHIYIYITWDLAS